jgi:AraC family transcriptional regulator of adaptative response/methylated-DNA-[protein]-cysteine methyltransferase
LLVFANCHLYSICKVLFAVFWPFLNRTEIFKTSVRAGAEMSGASYAAGFGSPSRLYAAAHERLGMTPGVYQDGGLGMEIRYVILDTGFGRLLAAATARGVCAVSLGEDDGLLEQALRQEYPAAVVRRAVPPLDGTSDLSDSADDSDFGMWVAAIVRHLQGALPRLDLPLDLQASAFQLRVWEALRGIPYGETRSYGEVARAMGQPGAARAVARACAANPAALLIPCHRVVRGDGQPGGYRWGSQRKRALLDQENALRMTTADDRDGA